DPGENVGLYNITQGTLSLGTAAGNYDLTFTTGVEFEITKRAITVTADAKMKTYGDANPTLTYEITSGSLFGSDSLSGALTRDPGENVGLYDITQGTLVLSANYDLTYVAAKLEINKRAITVTPDSGQLKTYGNSDPALTYKVTSGALAFSDAFTGALARDAGENVGLYNITEGTLSLGTAAGNYNLTFTTGVEFEIKKRPVTVTADAKMKTYGDDDPAFTYQITSGSLFGNDSFSGALTRDAGENVGLYDITQGTLALSSNYALTYIGAKLEIKKRPITVTPDSGQFKIYGNSPAALTYEVTDGSLAFTDAFTGALSRDVGENIGFYNITQGTLSLGTATGNYNLTFATGVKFEIKKRPVTVTADAKIKTY